MQAEYPSEMWRPASGHSQDCYSAAEEADLKLRGYERLHGAVGFQASPMMVSGKGLPDLIVENEDQAKEAAERSYDLPSQAELALAEEGFAAAHAAPVEEAYSAQRYPLMLRHPLHRDAIPTTWEFSADGVGVPIPGSPEEYPDVIVYSPAEEAEWRAKGWTSPALPPDEPEPSHAGADDPEYAEFLRWKRSQAQPGPSRAKRKLSGAARRKLHRLRPEQQEIAP